MEGKELNFNIPYIKLRIDIEILNDTIFPATKVSALRGGLGEMILQRYCVSDRNCNTCKFKRTCVAEHTFYSFMEKKPAYLTGRGSIGYLIECYDYREYYSKGSRMKFYLILFGESIGYFDVYFQAFCELGKKGIGKHKAIYRITDIINEKGEVVVHKDRKHMDRYNEKILLNYIQDRKKQFGMDVQRYIISFVTPFSMKYMKKYMNEFNTEALVKGAARRVEMLNYYIGHEVHIPEFSLYPKILSQTIKKECYKRYSSTHKSDIYLRGISGKVVLSEMSEECLDYLLAGELLHIGKNTSFGFGKYRIKTG